MNGTAYRNKITKLPSNEPEEGYASGNYWRKKGGSLYDFYMYEWLGVDEATGEPLYTGKDGAPVHEPANAKLVQTGKSAVPDLYGGVISSWSFFGVDLSAQFAYQLGGWTLDSNYQGLMSAGTAGTNWHKDIFRRWTPQNTSTDVPRVQNRYQDASQTSTRFLTKASYISLKNVTLGYTFPKSLMQKAKISSLRVYVVGDNLWYMSKRRGLDVRQSFSGATGFTYSALRTVSAGVSFIF